MYKLEHLFNVPINIIDTQKIKAFTYQKSIYLSVGLLERLEQDEVKAVIAHEIYHLNNGRNKFLSSFLALTSLTFLRYDDEHHADRYAADIAGIHNLANALKKLEIKDYEKRIEKL
jgi:heat shock protein HtpX